MFVGETGVGRVVQRSAELTRSAPDGNPRSCGGVDLPTIQKYVNLWYSLSLNLFGSEVSTNAASYFGAGLKGRAKEEAHEDHLALSGVYPLDVPEGGSLVRKEVPLRSAMNEILRDGYVEDCQRAVDRWNKICEGEGVAFRFRLPSRRFHRRQGVFAEASFDTDGNMLSRQDFEQRKDGFLPSAADKAFVKSLQQRPVSAPGEMAQWLAPPSKGINGQPLDFVYVRAEV